MEAREARRYSTPAGSADFTAASPGVPNTAYNSLDEIAAIAGAVLVRFEEPMEARYIRVNFYPVGVGSDNETFRDDVYAVLPSDLDGTRKYELQYMGQAPGSIGTDPVAGGRAGHKHAKTCTWSTSGYAEALSGGMLEVKPFPAGTGGQANPAGFAVHDIGHAVGLLVVPAKGAATPVTSTNLRHERWR